jgi:hydroxyethylthiazole kinase-like uncharacterized protein yjeF
VEQMRELERLTFAAGRTEDELQRRAGRAVADAVTGLHDSPTSVVALVGSGNNGRDAFIATDQLLSLGWLASLYLTPRHAISDAELAAFTQKGGRIVRHGDDREVGPRTLLDGVSFAIDGLLGIGGRGPLRPPLSDVAEAVNAAHDLYPQTLVIAVDAPSGVDADTGVAAGVAVQADATVLLGAAKRGLLTPQATPYTGRLIFADIGVVDGFRDSPELVTRESVRGIISPPAPDAHKGSFGRLLVVAGSERYVGAAYLVCAAAVRSGAGVVTLAAPRWLRDVTASRLSEITYLPLPDAGPAGAPQECAETILSEIDGFSALAMGPGLSTDGGLVGFVEAVLHDRADRNLPTILDADGLNCLARLDGWPSWLGANVVMTPHLGELRRLAPDVDPEAPPWETATRLSSNWPSTLVLKGPFTSIGHRGRAWVHALPNAALATGGTGDVLTGIIGGLLARGLAPEAAAQLGVWVHGRVGIGAVDTRYGGGLVASDLTFGISSALSELIEHPPKLDLQSP